MTLPAPASTRPVPRAARARRRAAWAILLPLALTLAGCDMLGIESATQAAERKVGEGKATGAACRHAGRAIEDCYTLNKKADRAAVYAGWREMDEYMRENKLEAITPVVPVAPRKPRLQTDEEDGAGEGDVAAGDDAAQDAAAPVPGRHAPGHAAPAQAEGGSNAPALPPAEAASAAPRQP